MSADYAQVILFDPWARATPLTFAGDMLERLERLACPLQLRACVSHLISQSADARLGLHRPMFLGAVFWLPMGAAGAVDTLDEKLVVTPAGPRPVDRVHVQYSAFAGDPIAYLLVTSATTQLWLARFLSYMEETTGVLYAFAVRVRGRTDRRIVSLRFAAQDAKLAEPLRFPTPK